MPVNNCDYLLKDAFRGIELEYKLNSVISNLQPNQKFSWDQLEGYLKKQGVSPYEIKASRLPEQFSSDNRVFTGREWDQMNLGEQMFENKFTTLGDGQDYADISLGGRGAEVDDYTVKEFMTTKQNKSTNLRHEFGDTELDESYIEQLSDEYNEVEEEMTALFITDETRAEGYRITDHAKADELKARMDEISKQIEAEYGGAYSSKSQLGWNRIHQDEINGKPTTVLNELQSDWMQAERQGAGIFESKVQSIDTEKTKQLVEEKYGFLPDNWREVAINNNYIVEPKAIIADFPMKPEKFQQLMIVDAINESIENGTNRVVIPIERENELAGSAGVTKFYRALDKQIKAIEKKLSKQGLKLKLGKEDYKNKTSNLNEDDKSKIKNILPNLDIDSAITLAELEYRLPESEYNKIKNLDFTTMANELHTIEVIGKPESKVKWDVYSLIGSLGLTEEAIRLSIRRRR